MRRAWWRVGAAVVLGAAVWVGAAPAAEAQGKGVAAASAAEVEEARRLNQEVLALYRAGKFDEAVTRAQRALAIIEKALGPDHPAVAASLDNLALLYQSRGEYVRAEPLYERALAIIEKVLGPDHPDVATSLNNLALLYKSRGEYVRAEPLYERALAIYEKALGPDHPAVANSLNNLALLYKSRGEYVRAEPLYQRALAIIEKVLGPDHPDVATDLNNLALLYQSRGEYVRAEPLLQRALAIIEKALGPDHPEVATSLNNLAELYRSRGEYVRAEPLYQRALAIKEKALGPDHPAVANSLNNLALLYQSRGEYVRAEPLYQRALAILEKALGPDHPHVAASLNNLAALSWARGDRAAAGLLQVRADRVREKMIDENVVSAGSELQKRAYIEQWNGEVSTRISFALEAHDGQAAGLAIVRLLRDKGRALDAMAGSFLALRAHLGPGDQRLFDELAAARSQYANLAQRGLGSTSPDIYKGELNALTDRIRDREGAISQRSTAFRAAREPVTLDAIQTALPEGAALVEWAQYEPFNPKGGTEKEKWGPAHYAASVLPKHGDPVWVDLGDADTIEAAIQTLRHAFARPANKDAPALARALEARVMAPVRALLGDTRRVFLSPDGALNLIPFAALLGEDGRPLVERYAFTYLTSGRDLFRRAVHAAPRAAPLVVTNPDFAPGNSPFAPLDHASEVSDTIAARFQHPSPSVLTGAAATKAALQKVTGPQFLHLDTHGYFDAEVCTAAPSEGLLADALLRSGIALAGANACTSGNHAGLLTAKEASGLDLYGTRLVVLSACETGVGDAKAGDGIYGLRRALVLAGAETQVMSLWPVDGAATADLMKAYYEALAKGGGRSEAMRQVQLAMLHDSRREHPYYWASFIVSGDDRSLEGMAVEPELKVHPGGACACRMGEQEAARDASVLLATVAALAIGGRRLAARRARRRCGGRPTMRRPGRLGSWWRLGVAAVVGAAVMLGTAGAATAQGNGGAEGTAELEEARQLDKDVVARYGEGKLDAAVPLAQRALVLREKWLGPDHVEVAKSLNNLALLYKEKGEYGRAEPLYQRALAIWEKELGHDHPGVAVGANNLARLYEAKGEYDRAEPLYQRALAIFEKAVGFDPIVVASPLDNLALLYQKKGEYGRAEPLYQRALAIWENSAGPNHPYVAIAANNLAALYVEKGEYERAEPLAQRALAIREKAFGEWHPDVATTLNNLAALYHFKGDYGHALPLYERAVAIRERALGPDHPEVADSLYNLAALHWASGRLPMAIDVLTRGADAREKTLGLLVATGSEAQKLAFLKPFLGESDGIVSFAVDTGDARGANLAMLALFRHKGRALDAMAGSYRVLRARLGPEEQRLLDDLQATRSRYVTLSLRGPGETPPDAHKRGLGALEEQIRQLEDTMSKQSEAFKAEEQPVTVVAVQAALPDDAALIEWTVYRPFDPKAHTQRERFGADRYAASVLPKHGTPAWVDLGDAAAVDADIQALRDAFTRPAGKDAAKLARALEARVMAPVRALLGDTRRVFLSPDGQLNLIPFAALTSDDGRPLIERYALTYLTSGRDLLRRAAPTSAREAPLVVTSPAFDLNAPGGSPFAPLLRGTEVSATIAARFQHPTPILVTGRDATKARLQQVHGPQFLHLGSHGYFDDNGCTTAPPEVLRDNPLLRSGIALAGANACTSGHNEGLLTASEASGLDLYGTRLAVLSACRTGTGDVKAGDGVYGLRRALVLAGAETQVMSLWSVDEAATAELMQAYYEGLAKGEGRSDAMRKVQLAMLHDGRHEHPYYWAPFIVSGDDRPLDGKAAAPDLRIHPGGACACRMGERQPEGGPSWLAGLAAAAWIVRRAYRGRTR
jgi:CHAT domain-containing protein/Tfp pilus assembly protein PilF